MEIAWDFDEIRLLILFSKMSVENHKVRAQVLPKQSNEFPTLRSTWYLSLQANDMFTTEDYFEIIDTLISLKITLIPSYIATNISNVVLNIEGEVYLLVLYI